MGHSKSTPSIAKNKGFRPELTRKKAAEEHADILKEKNAAQTMDYACRCILPMLPNGSAKIPVYYTVRYSVQFLWDTQQYGVDYAAKNLFKGVIETITKEQIIPMVTKEIWSRVDDEILMSGANKALAKVAEEALSETLATIVEKGIDAL